jgi:hypothetical protein
MERDDIVQDVMTTRRRIREYINEERGHCRNIVEERARRREVARLTQAAELNALYRLLDRICQKDGPWPSIQQSLDRIWGALEDKQ